MAYLIKLQTFTDTRGNLSVIDNFEKVIPFKLKRVFYIYGVDASVRGGHRHHKTIQAAICINGQCTIYNNDNNTSQEFHLDAPEKCLILKPEDWHKMYGFSKDAILLVFASESFDPKDYIYEEYPAHD